MGLDTTSQDICVMGVVRRVLQNVNVPNLPFLIGAAIIFILPLFKVQPVQF